MNADSFLDRFHAAITSRKVLTNPELRAARESGCNPEDVARENDALAAEYDDALAAEGW